MLITDRFVVEHQVFLRQLTFLDQTLDAPLEDLPSIIRAITQTLHGPLEAHREGEEELLFPAMEASTGGGPSVLPVMIEEHRDIQGTIAEIGTTSDGARARRLAEHLIDVLRQHIAKEDEMLFPSARELLGDPFLEELDRRYGSVPALPVRR